MIPLTREPIDYAALTEAVRRPNCGAVALFLGTVRDLTGDQVTVALDYEAYPEMAEKTLAQVEQETREREDKILFHRPRHTEMFEVQDSRMADRQEERQDVKAR